MIFIESIFIYNFLFFAGRGFAITLSKVFKDEYKENIFGLNHDVLYIFYSLFVIGNLSVILNFFFPIRNIITFIFLCLLILINYKNKIPKSKYKLLIYCNFLTPLVLSVSALNIGFHYDAGLYHLNFQNWILNNKIVIGLSNLYLPFGASSLNDYILSNFWFSNNFIYMHYLNVSVLTAFFTFLITSIFFTKNSFYKFGCLFLILFSILDNFGIGVGTNGSLNFQGIGKVDVTFGILYLFIFSIFTYLIKENKYDHLSFFTFNFLILLSIQLKIFGSIFVILYFLLIKKYINTKQVKLIHHIRESIILIFISLIWIFKNYLMTSCLFYPIQFTCIKSNWYSERPSIFTKYTQEFHNAINLDSNLLNQLNFWLLKNDNSSFVLNFLGSVFILLVIKFLFFGYFNTQKVTLNYFFLLLSTIIYFISSPSPRFFYGITLSLVFLIGINIKDYKFKTKFHKPTVYLFVIFSLIFTTRLSSYEELLNYDFSFKTLSVPKIEYVNNDIWGVKPAVGDQCWINLDCSDESLRYIQTMNNSYIMFLPLDD